MNNALYPNGLPLNLTHFEGTNLSLSVVEALLADSIEGGDAQMATLCHIALYAPCAQGNNAARRIEQLLFAEAA